MNKTFLIGNITKDLELKVTQSGKKVLNFTLAFNKGYGENKVARYFNVVAWENLAEKVSLYCHKGSKVCVEGELDYDEFEKDGSRARRDFIRASNVEFLDARPKDVQVPLTGNARDVTGHFDRNVSIDQDDLPFI